MTTNLPLVLLTGCKSFKVIHMTKLDKEETLNYLQSSLGLGKKEETEDDDELEDLLQDLLKQVLKKYI